MLSIVLTIPPKYFSVRIGCIFAISSIRAVREKRTKPPTQKSKEIRSHMNCQPFPVSRGKKNG